MANILNRLTLRLGLLALAATLPLMGALFLLQANERDEEYERAVAEHRHVAHMAATSASALLISTERLVRTLAFAHRYVPADSANCAAILREVAADRPELINIAVIDRGGNLVCAASPVNATAFRRSTSQSWFQQVLAGDTVVVSDPLHTATSGARAIIVAAPIRPHGRSGARGIVLAAALDVGAIANVLANADAPTAGVISLLDRANRIIATFPTVSANLGIRIPMPSGISRDLDAGAIREIPHPGGAMLIAALRNNARQATGFHVVVSMDERAAVAVADARWDSYMKIIGVAGLVALLLAIVAARRLVITPARDLARVARRLARGDLTARAVLMRPVGGLSEVGGALNEMAGAIAAREADRDRAIDDLQRAKRQDELLFEENPSPMWVYDAGTLRFLTVNVAAVRNYGYTRDEFLAMRITDIRPAEDVDRCIEAAATRSPGLVDGAQWRHHVKSGEIIDVEIASHTIPFEGRPAVLVCARDISARLAAEQGLREAEERMRFALDAANVGIWEANLVTGVAHWSTTNERMHGLEPGGFGRNLGAFLENVHPDERDAVRSEIDLAQRQHRNANLEYRPRADARRRLRSIGHFIHDESGRPVRGAGVTLDVTDRREMEEQLRHAQKLEAIGQLAGGVAHDFNNLLTVISGNGELALRAQVEPEPKADIEEILRASSRAAQLTRQLLAFSRKQVIHATHINVDEMVRRLLPMLSRLIEEDVSLEYDGCQDNTTIFADQTEIEQAIINLVVNARDALPGGGTVRLEVSRIADHPTNTIRIAVIDYGMGMTPEVLGRAFEPFFTTKPLGKGTGLGLASVYGTVKQAGGEVTIDSEVGKGTRVAMLLPADDSVAPTLEIAADEQAMLHGKGTILLIEDQEGVRSFAARVLRRNGYRVLEAADATEALRQSNDHKGDIALIFSDVVVPGPSIVDAIERIRLNRPSIAVVMTSGYPDAEVRRRLGAMETDLFPKPFGIDALLSRVHTAITRRGGRVRTVA